MSRMRWLSLALVCAAVSWGASSAVAATTFHPRVRNGLGLMPPVSDWGKQDIASGAQTPAVYHGGSVMAGGVTIHTIFWGPQSKFEAGYEALVKRYLADVAHDSGKTTNEFSVLTQYAQGTRPGGVTAGAYAISYDPTADSIDDTDAYPTDGQCASPTGIQTCLTDGQVQSEINTEIGKVGGSTGLHDLWFVFLPTDVDECITAGVCGTNAFAGYHSVGDFGKGPMIYAIAIDPAIEVGSIPPGQDPQGNPNAEATLQTAGHETIEAMTDPEGVGWMDPNGSEVGDKCENPEYGTPLGVAPDGSPFNQLINNDEYLIQEMWSNDDNGCVQSTTATGSPLPLPQVNLTQFSPNVSGNIGSNTAGVNVEVQLVRANANGNSVTVATTPEVTTNASGAWSTALAGAAFGDDRDEILVSYSGAGAPTPHDQVILTGNGGNAYEEAGWTGWTALDNGTFLTNSDFVTGNPSLTVGPCFQTGVLSYTVDGAAGTQSLDDNCNTQTDDADVALSGAVKPSDVITVTSDDNRAYSDVDGPSPNPNGGLVSLTVPVGEPDSVSLFVNPMSTLLTGSSGFPSCTADLELATATCTGLVPGNRYTFTVGRKHVAGDADPTGTAVGQFAAGVLKRGRTLALSNGSRTLTTVRLANLRVKLVDAQTAITSGTCSPGEYFGPGLTAVPTNSGAGVVTPIAGGSALTGEICPRNGKAAGFSTDDIAQTDQFSGGTTQTEVPDIENTSPLLGETVYGAFTALAQSGLPGPNNSVMPTDSTSKISLTVVRHGHATLVASNVDKKAGVTVAGLPPGAYKAVWVLTDANGDTRTVTGRFIEAPGSGRRGGPKPTIRCKLLKHNRIKCAVSFAKSSRKATVRLALARASGIAALGHARLTRGSATVTMRTVGQLSAGRWTMTVVLAQPRKSAATTRVSLTVR